MDIINEYNDSLRVLTNEAIANILCCINQNTDYTNKNDIINAASDIMTLMCLAYCNSRNVGIDAFFVKIFNESVFDQMREKCNVDFNEPERW